MAKFAKVAKFAKFGPTVRQAGEKKCRQLKENAGTHVFIISMLARWMDGGFKNLQKRLSEIGSHFFSQNSQNVSLLFRYQCDQMAILPFEYWAI